MPLTSLELSINNSDYIPQATYHLTSLMRMSGECYILFRGNMVIKGYKFITLNYKIIT